MTFELSQKQSKTLLEEHVQSSINFNFWSRNEWIFALVFIFVGIALLLFGKSIQSTGYVGVFIGIFELIKFPTRSNRWVSRKIKEKQFDQELLFEINQKGLSVTINKEKQNYIFDKMNACLISETGVLFKISYYKYYYISFQTIEKKYAVKTVLDFIKTHFDPDKLKTKIICS